MSIPTIVTYNLPSSGLHTLSTIFLHWSPPMNLGSLPQFHHLLAQICPSLQVIPTYSMSNLKPFSLLYHFLILFFSLALIFIFLVTIWCVISWIFNYLFYNHCGGKDNWFYKYLHLSLFWTLCLCRCLVYCEKWIHICWMNEPTYFNKD